MEGRYPSGGIVPARGNSRGKGPEAYLVYCKEHQGSHGEWAKMSSKGMGNL